MIPLHDDNPTRQTPFVTVAIVVLCTLVFLWQLSFDKLGFQRVVVSLGLIPAVLVHKAALPAGLAVVPPELTVYTSMFLHGGWMHLIGNMLFLWIFGNNVEDAMGHARFVLFYLACGTAAAMTQTFMDPSSTIPMIGASGAISGVLGAYLLLFPHARVLVLIPLGFLFYTLRLAAGWVLGFWFLIQLISSLLSNTSQGGVAFFAHIGGFVAGMALIPLFKHRNVRLLQPPRFSRRYWH